MDDIMWKCSTAFVLGAATHYLISTYLSNEKRNEIWESVRSAKSSNYTGSSAPSSTDASEHTPGDDMAASKEIASESSEDNDWEGKDSSLWQPQKMVLCVRTDLGMGKGKIAAQCCHATLGAYKLALRKNPKNVETWEAIGQAKVCLKIESEEELAQLAETANALHLNHYIVVDAGRTQIAPDTKTVLGIGPASVDDIDVVTRHLKLL